MQVELSLTAEAIAKDAITMAQKNTAHLARVERVFEAMRSVIEGPDARLKHYKVDFYEHDHAYLQRTYATGLYGWVIRESGTHLVQLGRHPRMNEELDAALKTGPSRNGTYLSPWRVPILSDALASDVTRLFQPWVRLRSSFAHSWFDATGTIPNARLRDQVEQETLVVGCCQTSGQPFSP